MSKPKRRRTRIQRLERKLKAVTDLALATSKYAAHLHQEIFKLTEEKETIERVLEVMQENSGFKKDILKDHTVRLDSLEINPIKKFCNWLFSWSPKRKVSHDGCRQEG